MTLKVNLSGDVFTNPYNTKECTFLLLRISLRISPYMFQLNCHHQSTETIVLKTYSNKIVNNAYALQMYGLQFTVQVNGNNTGSTNTKNCNFLICTIDMREHY